jgi:hypothetical protein
MKIINIRRKLAAALVAGGLFVPAASPAADLNTNLITDGGFENIDEFDVGQFESVRLLDWPDSDLDFDFFDDNFAYAYSLGYAGSNPSPEAGLYHFTGGFNTTAGDAQIVQSIDISTGETGALVPTGSAFYRLSGYFTSYRNENSASGLRARFLDSNDAELGVAEIGGLEFVQSLPITNEPIANQRDWGLDSGVGMIPAGTRTVQIEVFADAAVDTNDGYVDLVDFRVGETNEFVLRLTINRASGALTLTNSTLESVSISEYSITSAFGALDPAEWLSIAENYDANSGGSVDASSNWSELSSPDDHTALTEADTVLAPGATIAPGQTVVLAEAGGWIKSPTEDVRFEYTTGGTVVPGTITFDGNNDEPFSQGDLDFDNDLDLADWTLFRQSQHVDLTALSPAEAYQRGDFNGDLENNHADFVQFKRLFNAANGAGALEAALAGVPEPATWLLFVFAGGPLYCFKRITTRPTSVELHR